MNNAGRQSLVTVFLVLCAFVTKGLACNGYKARIVNIENCDPDSVMQIDTDMKLELTEDCNLVTTGCVESKPFTTSMVSYKLFKNKVKMFEGKKDMCAEMESAKDDIKQTLQMLSMPQSCPVTGGKLCSDDTKKINIGKHKSMLAAAKGVARAELRIEHDSGKTCINVESEIYKG